MAVRQPSNSLRCGLVIQLLVASCLAAQDIEVRFVSERKGAGKACFSPDGGYLAWVRSDFTVHLEPLEPSVAIRNDRVAKLLQQLNADRYQQRQAAFFALAERGREVESELRRHLLGNPPAEVRYRIRLLLDALRSPPVGKHRQGIEQLAFSPDSRLIASASADHTVKVWHTASGRLVRTLGPFDAKVTSIRYSDDGRFLAAGAADNRIYLWSVDENRLVDPFAGHEASVSALAFVGRGSQLCSAGSFDRSVRIWQVPSGRLNRQLPLHPDAVMAVAVSPTELVASAGYDSQIRVWKIDDGQLISSIQAHTGVVRTLVFLKDPRYVASGGDDGNVCISNWKAGRAVCRVEGHSAAVDTLSCSPSGERLASSSQDGVVKLWKVTGASAHSGSTRAGSTAAASSASSAPATPASSVPNAGSP